MVLSRLFQNIACIALLAASLGVVWSQEGKQPAGVNTAALDRVFTLQRQIRDIHPAFGQVYPIAIVQDKKFYVYVPDTAAQTYKLTTTVPDKFNVPAGVRAAMPLDFLNNRIACVVTPEVFDKLGGYATVFHEFVHCYQWESCEMRLKESLQVYRKALENKDYMWELQYRFPYADPAFRQDYEAMLKAIGGGDPERAFSVRKALKGRLPQEDREYMTWQEWKEGLARYLENLVAARLGTPQNHGGLEPPFTRVSFYAGGEALIRMLVKQDPAAANDVEALFRQIAN